MTQEQLKTFLQELAKKNSWSKYEIKDLILNILTGIVK